MADGRMESQGLIRVRVLVGDGGIGGELKVEGPGSGIVDGGTSGGDFLVQPPSGGGFGAAGG